MDVPCHKCGEIYDCELHQYQGLCPYCETGRLADLKPGSKITDQNGVEWIRMHDDPGYHLEGFLFNVETGRYMHCSRVAYTIKMNETGG